MKNKLIDRTNEFWLESLVILVAFAFTWLGFGPIMIGALLLGFFVSLFFKQKASFILRDRVFIFILVLFVINAVISSLLSIDTTKSTLLSMVAFLWIYVPYSYIQFSINDSNAFFVRSTSLSFSCIPRSPRDWFLKDTPLSGWPRQRHRIRSWFSVVSGMDGFVRKMKRSTDGWDFCS